MMRNHQRRAFACRSTLVFGLLCLAAIGAFAQPDTLLPPEDCVRLLREARIARMESDAPGELAKLRQARQAFPEEIVVVTALLDFHNQQALPEDEHASLLASLQAQVGNRDKPLPFAPLWQTVTDRKVTDATLTVLEEQLRLRSEGQESPEPALLRLLARTQLRLDQRPQGFETLKTLWNLTGDENLRWTLAPLTANLKEWSFLIDLLEEVQDDNGFFQGLYVKALSKVAPFDRIQETLTRISEQRAAEEAAENADYAYGVASTNASISGLLRNTAWTLWDRGMEAEAETLFRQLLVLKPEHREANAVVLHLFASQEEKAAKASAVADSWAGEDNPQRLLDEGTHRLTTGDAEGAFDLLQRAAPEFPELEAVWYNLGMAGYRLEKWQVSADAFAHAAKLNPQRAEAFYFGGLAWHKLGRCAEAVTALDTALGIDPGRTQAHYYLAACHRELGDSAAAQKHTDLYNASKD